MNFCRLLKRHQRYEQLFTSKHAHTHSERGRGRLSLFLPCCRHQKQALTFMLRRERGWALCNPQEDLWSVEIRPSGSRIYTNNITQDTQDDAPPEFRGGILADYMGLGKTLSMISLIASDYPGQLEDNQRLTTTSLEHHTSSPPPLACPSERHSRVHGPSQLTKTTLLIVPSSLLQSWESQLIKHLHFGAFRWVKHHGSHKLRDCAQLRQFNLVISTFQTVSSEYGRHAIAPSVLFSTSWHRIVLDEAHCIRNRNTTTAKAVCAIQATSRWAMTGTPLQNRLTDFASLLQFLRVFPYSDHKVFESLIAETLDDALIAEDHQSRMYIHAFAKINTLRKFCNLGLYAQTLKADIGNKLRDSRALAWNTTAQEAFENLAFLGQASCDESLRVQLAQNLRLICDTCSQQAIEDSSAPICVCEDREPCLEITVSSTH
jgi:SNF2-related domain